MSAARNLLWCAVVALLLCSACGDDAPAPQPMAAEDAGPGLQLLFGEPCVRNFDCTTGACVQVAEGRGVCTYGCGDEYACPAIANWACAPSELFGVSICDCASDSTQEICGDGVDNDCDGILDCVTDLPDAGGQCPGSPGCPLEPDLCSLDPALCPTCTADADCDDDLDCTRDLCRLRGCLHVPDDSLCEATEVCRLGAGCEPGVPCATHAECADTDACTRAEHCDPQNRVCRFVILDGDDDERFPASCGGNDCDDSDPDTFEGALDVCDGEDNNCDGMIDPPSAGLACGPGRTCWQGECLCDVDHVDCRQRCLPPSAFLEDDLNCGSCGNACWLGWACDAGTCVDVDECVLMPGYCGAHSICQDAASFPDCNCEAGYFSATGDNCTNVDECSANSDNCSSSPQACVDTDGSFDCVCPTGYSGTGVGPTGCADINECTLGTDNCMAAPAASCINTTGGFYCQCESGYSDPGFDDTNCADINECMQNADNCSAVPDACVNTVGSFDCECPSGYTGTGVGAGSCTDIEECVGGTLTCNASLRCLNTVGSAGCATPVLQVATQTDHGCAVLEGGTVKCWGFNHAGQLGVGHTLALGDAPDELGNNLPEVNLGTGLTAKFVTAGNGFSCALLNDDSVKCWGANGNGQLGLGDTSHRGIALNQMGDALPRVALGTGRTVKALSSGDSHSCALLDDNTVKCWGYNNYGQLGLGNTVIRGDGPNEMGDQLPVVALGTGRTAKAISAGGSHTCAVLDDDTVKCWGYNTYGVLGLGNTTHRGDGINEMGDLLPAVVLGTGRTAKAVSAGPFHTCAVLDDNTIKCWGYNATGALGIGSTLNRGDGANEMGDQLPAVLLGTGRTAKAVRVTNGQSCAWLDDDRVKCWGYNSDGTLGVGDTNGRGDAANEMGDMLPAINLGTGRHTIHLASGAGSFHCVVLDNGLVKCWGQNGYGQLGLGDTASRGGTPGSMGDFLYAVPISDLQPGL